MHLRSRRSRRSSDRIHRSGAPAARLAGGRGPPIARRHIAERVSIVMLGRGNSEVGDTINQLEPALGTYNSPPYV